MSSQSLVVSGRWVNGNFINANKANIPPRKTNIKTVSLIDMISSEKPINMPPVI
jgi:hypothetical protein